mgnify:CR=1 FL=1
MPKTSTELNRTKERKYWMERLQNLLTEAGEVCLEYKGNGLCVPAVDENGNEYYLALTVAIPTGGRDGEKFDGYAVAQDYKLHKEEVAFTTQQRAEQKKDGSNKRVFNLTRSAWTGQRRARREALQARKLMEEEKRQKIREAMLKAKIAEDNKKKCDTTK